MKIGILTFHAALNVGAQLQALALFDTIKALGHEVYFIRYEPKYLMKHYSFFRNVKINKGFASCIKQILLHVICDTCTWTRTKLHYSKFQNKFFRFSLKKIHTTAELANSDFNAFIVGSDQIWNPEITNGSLDLMYTLQFSSDNIRKISYAASFSEKHIKQDDARTLVESLKTFYAISVREYELKQYLKSFCNLKIEVVLDPTLLLSKSDWLAMMPPKRIIKERYVLLYQARGEKDNVYKQAIDLANKLNATVYDASGMNYRIMKHGKQYVSPVEFINLIFFAEAIVTISFHGTAMSLILEKPFFSICLNDGRDGRVLNLLRTVRLVSQLKSLGEDLPLPNIDYSKVGNFLEIARKNSLSFLNNALN